MGGCWCLTRLVPTMLLVLMVWECRSVEVCEDGSLRRCEDVEVWKMRMEMEDGREVCDDGGCG